MKKKITSLTNPVWINEEKTAIDCVITLELYGDEKLPFTASQFDVEKYGRDLFESIKAGNYGIIGEYVPPQLTILNNSTESNNIPVVEIL